MATQTAPARRRREARAYREFVRSCPTSRLLDGEVTPTVPVRVDYRLTPLGGSLLPVVSAVKDWADLHFADIEAARSAYDQRVEPIGTTVA